MTTSEPTHAREHWLRTQAEAAIEDALGREPAKYMDSINVDCPSELPPDRIRSFAIIKAQAWLRIAAWAHRLEVRGK